MVAIIKSLLAIVSLLMQWANGKQQEKIGRDEYIKRTLVQLAIKAKVAKAIDIRSAGMSDDDVDRILQGYYRDGE